MIIGIAGTGRMGSAIAHRLLGLGHELTVWNRTAEKAAALSASGATVAANPAALASSSEIVITILTDAAAIAGAYEGAGGLLEGKIAGKLFIEMSTVRPATQTTLAAKIRAKNASMIDCPVGGSVGPAREGKLIGFAGGEAADVARAHPLLAQICRRVEHVGPVGAGASMKLAINLPLMVYWQSFGEALSLCKELKLDPARMIDIFADTSGGPNVLKARGDMIATALGGKDTGPVVVDVDTIRKDMRTMIEEARSLGRTLPVTERALECFDAAARQGHGRSEGSLLPVSWVQGART